MTVRDKAGFYAADVRVGYARAGGLGWVVTAGWVAFPFALQTVFRPNDAAWALCKLAGVERPAVFTFEQEIVGFIVALFALAVLVLVQYVATVFFYKRAQLEMSGPVAVPPLWPLAAVLTGVIGNAAWWMGTGHFDLGGLLAGGASAALTVGGEMLCEKLGRNFVFSGSQPPVAQVQAW
jgi:hypothetical protein